MITFVTTCSLENFKAWAGGKQTLELIKSLGIEAINKIENLIEECFCESTPSETDINDFLWFDDELIAETLGYEDSDKMWTEYFEKNR